MGCNINYPQVKPKISSLRDLDIRDNGYYENICQYACRKGSCQLIELLLEKGVITVKEFYEKNENGVSPHMWANANRHKHVVEYLDRKTNIKTP